YSPHGRHQSRRTDQEAEVIDVMRAIKSERAAATSKARIRLHRLGKRVCAARCGLAYIASITVVAWMASSAVLAAEAEPFAAPRAADPIATSPAGGLVQVTLSLLLVLAAVFAAAWAVRRLRGFGRLAPGAIEVIADVALGPKERAVLVQVGKQQLLLGVASGKIGRAVCRE